MATDIHDPYGVDLVLDVHGDLQVNVAGALADVVGIPNCAQALCHRLNTAPGELPLHEDYGSTLIPRTIGSKLDASMIATEVASESRQLLAQDRRFQTVVDTQVLLDPAQANAIGVQIALRLQSGEVLDVTATDIGVQLADVTQRPDLTPQDLEDLASDLVVSSDDPEDDTELTVDDLIEFASQ